MEQKEKNDGTMSAPRVFGFGLGAVGMNLCFATVGAFAVYFFTDYLGIAAGVAGTILMISRTFDGFSDIGMGIIVDKTRSKYGKARPYLLWVAIPMAVSLVLLFSAPNFSDIGKISWAFLTYNLVSTIMYTAINVPYMSMMSLVTHDSVERSKMSIVKMILAAVTTLFVSAFTLKLVEAFGGGKKGWQTTTILYGVLAVAAFFTVFFSSREKDTVLSQPKKEKAQKGEFKNLLKNKYWIMMVMIALLMYLVGGIGGSTVYFCKYILGNEELMPILTFAGQLPTVLAMLFLTPLVKRFGKRNVSLFGMILMAAGCLIMAIFPESVAIVVGGLIFKAVGVAGIRAFVQPMLADTITYGEWKFGTKGEGKAFGGFSFGMKFGTGLGSAMIGWLLALGGYAATASSQSAATLLAIKTLYIYIPLVVAVLISVILCFYKLDKEYPMIVRELKQREK